MRSVDAVSSRAYDIVIKVLNKQNERQGDSKPLSRLPKDEQYTEQAVIPDMLYHASAQLPAMQHQTPEDQQPQTEFGWSGLDAFSMGDMFPQFQMGNFYANDASGSEYLNDPDAGLIDFGQPMMQMYYGNPYQTFDHWELDIPTFEDQGSGQYQGQEQDKGRGERPE
jgi:hypothetical protein